jgi:hypothetical protein
MEAALTRFVRMTVPPRGVYGMSKAAAEAGLEAMVKDTDMSLR